MGNIKKIAVRAGHNFRATGARGLIDETVEDRKVKDSVIKYLKKAGYDVLDVTPGDCDVNTDLSYGVNKAENFGADLFLSIHFDKCYDSYEGSLGHACWVYKEGTESYGIAKKIVNKVCEEVGFKNRGVKINPSLYELRKTSMSAIIIETCFCEATEDVKIYKEKGFDLIGKSIATGIAGSIIDTSNNVASEDNDKTNKKLWEISIKGKEVKSLQNELNKQFNAKIVVDGFFGDSTLNECIIVKKGARGNITRLIQQRLINRGYSSVGKADGIFGDNTEKAIKRLQECFDLSIDGIVGRNTWKCLYGLDKGKF
ncbi:N-acetylmuramoyl-L-alanine amidase [Clostridium chrysemydis]|uniref:N-acetylmuramoyl-L-alanine amidase n=1 Tax=Clostridium chrysemydis TaxID=2665504 RepID=UPI003F2E0FF7